MLPVKKIICPTDFSEPSMAALDAAVELAQHFDAELKILNVVSFMPAMPSDMMAITTSSYYPTDAERRKLAQEKLTEIVQQRVPAGVRVRTDILMGDAPSEITRDAAQEKADLIVIGTHGETGWRFLALGSVAAKVVRMAQRPVLSIYGGPVQEVEPEETEQAE